MALLGKVGGLAHDEVAAVFYLLDKTFPLGVHHYGYPVAHGYWIGATDSLQTEIALYLAIDQRTAVVCPDCVPASGALDYDAFLYG
jgi:hypothetical protein